MKYYDIHLVYELGADITVAANNQNEAIKLAKAIVKDDIESRGDSEYALDFKQCDYCKKRAD